ncbi:ATP-binding protein [Tersicoccus sp. MR15.9]|uniref:sensor histidine kinase n=1 Tax=Tersicoccus mangrovi TaxID=3121635 RepID=UPI002FE583FA
MSAPAPRQRRVSLAGQLLVLQLLVLLGVLVGVLWLSVGQSLRAFEAQEGRRALSAAESLAATPLVRTLLPDAQPGEGSALPSVLESVRSVSGLTEATLIDERGVVIASSDATLRGHTAPGEFVQGDPRRQWTGTTTVAGRQLLVARVPVFDDRSRRVGLAVAAREYPGWSERLTAAAPDLVLTLTVCCVVGLSGSWLLSRRLKRQTLGMEPGEIAALVEHREALLHGVKEGVVAVDLTGRLTVLNDAARDLLGWATVPLGSPAREVAGDEAVAEALLGQDDVADRTMIVGDRLLVANRRPITSHGRVIGSVTTLRDRTELFELEDQLGATRTATGLLRAQTHEFANQLHTVAGLIQLGETDEALRFVNGVSTERSLLVDAITERIADPPLAALLIAKSSVAGERGVALELDPDAGLGPVDEELSRDLITVAGNLIDNALDAASGTPDALVSVDVQDDGARILVTVQDSGPGLATDDRQRIFEAGFSTKASDAAGGRGFGLSLTRYVCRRRGGDVHVTTVDGAVFTAVLRRGPDVEPGALRTPARTSVGRTTAPTTALTSAPERSTRLDV